MSNYLSPLSELPAAARWRVFAVVASAAVLTVLDLTKINVGLPSVEYALAANSTQLQLIIAGYALAYGMALVPFGRLGDIHSRKAIFIVGLGAFAGASLLCAVAPTIELLVVARVLQGFAAGILPPQVLGYIQALFQGHERARAFGLFGAMTAVSTALGPALGGVLIVIGDPSDGWRSLFWVNLPFTLCVLYFAIRIIPGERKKNTVRIPLDLPGISLVGISAFCLMMPLSLTSGSPDDDPARWWWLAPCTVAGALFIWWERRYKARGKSPAVDFTLFTMPSFRNGLLVATTYSASLPAIFLLITLYLQDGLGLSAFIAGIVSVPFAVTATITALISGRLVAKYGRLLVVLGLIVVLIGFACTLLAASLFSPEWVPAAMAVALLLPGIGSGIVIAPNQVLTLAQVPVFQGGVAGSVMQVGQRIGNAMGIAITASIFYSTVYLSAADQKLEVYSSGFQGGIFAALALIAAALLFGLIDLWQRHVRFTAG